MMLRYLAIFVALLSSAIADEALDREFGAPRPHGIRGVMVDRRPKPALIKPGEGAFGIKWGSAPKALTDKFGPPSATLALGHDLTGMVYGHTHNFIHKNGKLVAIEILESWQPMIVPHRFFGGIDWVLPNGIGKGVPVAKAAKMVGDGRKLERGPGNYHAYVDGSHRVILQANLTGGKGHVRGLVIEPAAWLGQQRGVWAEHGKVRIPPDAMAHKLAHDLMKIMRPDIEKLYKELAPDAPKTFWDEFWELQMAYLRTEFEKMIKRVEAAQPKDPVTTYYLEGQRMGKEEGVRVMFAAGEALVKAGHMTADKLEALKLAHRLLQKKREAEEKQDAKP